jgi:hypothetical protein
VFDLTSVPPVDANELLARFILVSRHIRSSDNTVKPEAFMPHPYLELSMTRHRDATDIEIWREGQRVARVRPATLHGRADVNVSAFTAESLSVVAKPIVENPNHADALNWPAEKPAQKIKAIQIAGKSRYLPNLSDETIA